MDAPDLKDSTPVEPTPSGVPGVRLLRRQVLEWLKLGVYALSLLAYLLFPAACNGTETSPTGTGTVSALYGNFNIAADKITDTGCNFLGTFSGQVQLSGNSDGSSVTARMVEQLTRQYLGTMQTNGNYSASGTGNLNGFIYSGLIAGQVTGNTIQGNETLNFSSGCPGKQVVYHFTGNK